MLKISIALMMTMDNIGYMKLYAPRQWDQDQIYAMNIRDISRNGAGE
jgi:hypothetical protein